MYFNNCTTIEEVKIKFKTLASIHHPAKGGFLKVWEGINAEYNERINLKPSNPIETVPAAVMPEKVKKSVKQAGNDPDQEILSKAAEAKKLPGVRVVISGSWVWVTGNTKEVSKELKSMGFTWPRKKDDLSAWFYRNAANKCFKRGKKGLPLGQIEIKYGAKEI